jgi:predicted DNA-binding transcriptional regulator AlpA
MSKQTAIGTVEAALPETAAAVPGQENEILEAQYKKACDKAHVYAQSCILADYFTKQQLAAELGRTVRTLDRWLLRGDGPPKTPHGRDVLFRKEAVREWMRSREQKRPQRRIH